jgi:carbon storage regulator
MLVLTRTTEESVMVGDSEVKVLSIINGKVRLGINADRSIPVHRKEVYEAIQLDSQRPRE